MSMPSLSDKKRNLGFGKGTGYKVVRSSGKGWRLSRDLFIMKAME